MKIILTSLLAGLLVFFSSGGLAQTNVTHRLSHYSGPPAYQEAIKKLMLAEANEYVGSLGLRESFPITKNFLKEAYAASPYLAERFGILGSLATTNFSYGFGKGKHLCYITKIIKGTNPYDFNANKPYEIAATSIDTNTAYLLATQFLAKAFVDLNRLSTSSVVKVEPWVILHMTTCKYTAQWERNGTPIVKVVLTSPQNELWTLRVEDPDLIRRQPLQITNLDHLLSQTTAPASASQ